ncbi:aldo/keto reductase [Halorarum salinum]|uniref:Aldo/keto reductase n=1 Tax=Halorarum salinum TaxID=2743089 RepID=A0A7D5L9X3_9EURY|nr:aldo/keto reductase [Halobaculum salinum]QLG61552.1 aldo/keto reductase [Halobaculum salinum]
MPEFRRFGQGTYKLEGERCAESVETALELGYRHVDTAQSYDNEGYVGEALAAANVDREDVFVATKLATGNLAYDDAVESARESAERLGVDAIDLLYVHWPIDTYDAAETCRALDDLVDEGLVRNVGLSNFRPDQLREAREHLESPLFAHQVECHPLFRQEELRELAREDDHRLVAYCPIARNQVADVPEIREIAGKHDATPAQVSIAWLLAKEDVAAIPKATGEDHLRENLAATDLELDGDDVAAIDDLSESRRIVDFEEAPWNRV